MLPPAGLRAVGTGLTAADDQLSATTTSGQKRQRAAGWSVVFKWQPATAAGGSVAGAGNGTADSSASERNILVHGTLTDLISLSECPSVDGSVPGTSRWRYLLESSSPLPNGGRLTLRYLADATGEIGGHTTDTGMLDTFALDLRLTVSSSFVAYDRHGHVIARDPVKTESARIVRDGLRPGAGAAEVLDGATITLSGSIRRTITQVLGARDSSPVAAGFQALLPVAVGAAATEAGQVLVAAQDAHWQHGDCVIVVLTSGSGMLHSGDSTPVVAAIRDRTGQPGAPADLSASASSGADESPDSMHLDTGKTGTFTFTAPSGDWTAAGLTVKAVSHQGIGVGVATFHPLNDHYELVYTHTSVGSTSYNYDHSTRYTVDRGAYQENRNVKVEATVLLEAASDGTYSGSAPLHWDSSSWTTDNDNTSTNQAGGTCEIEFQESMSRATDGTLSVSSLKLGDQASADVTLANLAEHWQIHEIAQNGPCPVFDQTLDSTYLMNEIGNVHQRSGDTVTWTNDPTSGRLVSTQLTFDTGWQPGEGDTVATRTLTGSWYDEGPDDNQDIPYTDTFAIVRVSG